MAESCDRADGASREIVDVPINHAKTVKRDQINNIFLLHRFKIVSFRHVTNINIISETFCLFCIKSRRGSYLSHSQPGSVEMAAGWNRWSEETCLC